MKDNSQEEEYKLKTVQKLLFKDFEFENKGSESWDDLKNQLISYLNILLNKDFERLLQALYRIDVDEERVKEILNTGSPQFIADDLAELILERQVQKAITRLRYR